MRTALVLGAVLSLLAEHALANAWLKEKGAGEVISSTSVNRQRSGLAGGAAAQGYSGLHVEYGAFAKTTLIADAGYQQYTSQGRASTVFDAALAGGRFLLNRWENSILSVEALGGVSGVRESFNPGSPIAIQGATISRVGFGQGFDLFGRHAFASVEAGWRWRPGPPADELLFDTNIGIEPWSTGILMLQTFTIAGIGPANGAYRRYDLVKVQLSLAQRVSERWWVQAGALLFAAGADSGNVGVTFGLWRRF